MKKLLIMLAAISCAPAAKAQLQNLDFENWNYTVSFDDPAQNLPTGWMCTNRWFGYEEAQFHDRMVRPVDSIAQSNNYALRLFTFYNYMKDAAVQTAAINTRPAALNGFYKYEENFIIWGLNNYIDTAQVSVWLTKWNSALLKRDTIGFGQFSAHDSVKVFTPFQAAITYYSNEQPDSITIYLDPSFIGRHPDSEIQNEAHGGRSIFTVDNLSLANGATSLPAMSQKQTLTIYPNPATERINFAAIEGTAYLFDISGKQVMDTKLKNERSINIEQLSAGAYYMRIMDKKNQVYHTKFIKK